MGGKQRREPTTGNGSNARKPFFKHQRRAFFERLKFAEDAPFFWNKKEKLIPPSKLAIRETEN